MLVFNAACTNILCNHWNFHYSWILQCLITIFQYERFFGAQCIRINIAHGNDDEFLVYFRIFCQLRNICQMKVK